MKTIHKILMVLMIFTTVTSCESQIKNSKTATVKIYGNCGMCKKTIEKAANEKGIAQADWNVDSKMLTLTYDSQKTTPEAVTKKIAYAGYDSDAFRAPDAAYAKLPECCQYERPVQTKTVAATALLEAKTVTPAQEKGVGNVYAAYFDLKEALVQSNGASAAAKGTALVTAIKGVAMEGMKPEQHAVWMKALKIIQEDAVHIAGTKDIEHQRERFVSLSKAIYPIFKAFKAGRTVYYQNCPMFNDGKGATWVSRESTVKNPYYGAQMLSCGSTVETIQ